MTAEDLLLEPFGTVPALIRARAEAASGLHRPDPGRAASMTYGEFDALLDRVAASLQRDGVKPSGRYLHLRL